MIFKGRTLPITGPWLLQAEYPSYHPSNSVKALKGIGARWLGILWDTPSVAQPNVQSTGWIKSKITVRWVTGTISSLLKNFATWVNSGTSGILRTAYQTRW